MSKVSIVVALACITGVLSAAETDEPPAPVKAWLDAMEAQREATAKNLLASNSKADKKRGRDIKNGADFTPELFDSQHKRGTVGTLNAEHIAVVEIDGNTVVAECRFFDTTTAVDTSRGNEAGQVRFRPKTTVTRKYVRLEGIDIKGLSVDDEINITDKVFVVKTEGDPPTLQTFDANEFKAWRKANPLKKGKR